ncbi:MAG: hypothetical protein M5U34_48785 [Chloroflexi bacterium]|nr:hypothetical protein [Chloroflexota bacterium]
MITAVMVEKGQVLADYEPYLPVYRFPLPLWLPYPGRQFAATDRLGDGADAAAFGPTAQRPGSADSLCRGLVFTRRRLAGLLAAFLVALPFFFPAYYVSWGRLTQLTAVCCCQYCWG